MKYYHQTNLNNINSILNLGLIPKEPIEYASIIKDAIGEIVPVIWLTDKPKEIGTLDPDRVIFEIDDSILNKSGIVKLNVDHWWCYRAGNIPKEAIKIHTVSKK